MPRFFFHIHNDLVARDEEGLELADAEAAVREANRGARSLAAEQVMESGRLVLHHYIDVEDMQGRLVARVTFGNAVSVEE